MTVIEEVVRQIEFWFDLLLDEPVLESGKYRARATTQNGMREGECERMKDIILESDDQVFHVKSKLCKGGREYWVSFWFYKEDENIQLSSHIEQTRVSV